MGSNSSERKAGVLVPMYAASVVVVVFIVLAACAELCDGVAVVDVYRLVQYDISGVPFGSRLASLNHHAGSSIFSSTAYTAGTVADASRTVLILPLRELDLSVIKGAVFGLYWKSV